LDNDLVIAKFEKDVDSLVVLKVTFELDNVLMGEGAVDPNLSHELRKSRSSEAEWTDSLNSDSVSNSAVYIHREPFVWHETW